MKSGETRVAEIVKKRLEERVDRAFVEVKITDIIVVGAEGGQGEFEGLSTRYSDKNELSKESEPALIARLLAEIKFMVKTVEEIHLEKNFSSGPNGITMNQGSANIITRMNTNEFYFYPEAKRGPFTEAGFKSLIEGIEALARGSLENLHLILASFPLKNEVNDVHNMVIHVQCGPNAKIDTFAKSIPAEADIEYADTITPYFMSGGKINGAIEEMVDLIAKIDRRFNANLFKDSMKDLERLKALIVRYPVASTPGALSMIEAMLEFRDERLQLMRKFRPTMSLLVNHIKIKNEISTRDMLSSLANREIKTMKLPMTGHSHSGINYNNMIDCETAGGARFTTAIDVCLDHTYEIAKHRHRNAMSRSIAGSIITIPTAIAQVVTSNTVAINRDAVIGGDLVHVDPISKKVKYVSRNEGNRQLVDIPIISVKTVTNTNFGTASKIIIYPTRYLQPVSGEYRLLIDRLNALNLSLQIKLRLVNHGQARADLDQQIMDIRLRMAILLEDLYQIKTLLSDGAAILYTDESGISNLQLMTYSCNKQLRDWLTSDYYLRDTFSNLILSGDHAKAMDLYKQARQLGSMRKLNPVISQELSLTLKMDFFHLAVKTSNIDLIRHLKDIGLSVCVVDPATDRALYNDILALENNQWENWNHSIMRELKKIFSDNMSCELLLDSLNYVDNKELAMRLMLVSCIDNDNEVLFKALLDLGADCLGLDPTTNDLIINSIPQSGSPDVYKLVFDDVVDHDRVTLYVKKVIQYECSYIKIAFFLKFLNELPLSNEKATREVIDGLSDGGKFGFLELIRNDDLIFNRLPEVVRARVVDLVEMFHRFEAAVTTCDIPAIKHCLAAGMSTNLVFKNGMTPLSQAITQNSLAMVDVLLSDQPNLSLANVSNGATPVLCAIRKGHWQLVSRLYDYCATNGLLDAIFSVNVIQEIMMKSKCHIVELISSLPDESIESNLDLINTFLEKIEMSLEFDQGFGVVSMEAAIEHGKLTAARWLLDHGVNPHEENEKFVPLLSMAIQKNANEIALLLIERGSSLSQCDGLDRSPFCHALMCDNAFMLNVILGVKPKLIDVNEIEPKLDSYPLLYAADNDFVEAAKALIQHGANVDIVDEEFNITPLMMAMRNDSSRMVDLLVSKGADLNRSVGKWTPLTYLMKHGRSSSLLDCLLSSETININQRQLKTKMTALHLAVIYNKLDMAEILIKSGVDLSLENHRGETAMATAVRLNKQDFVKLFMSCSIKAGKGYRP